MISPASTAFTLAKPDRIVRLAPNDLFQAQAIGSLLENKEREHVIVLYRDDIYGRELVYALSSVFKGRMDCIAYDPGTLNAKALLARAAALPHSCDKSAVLTISFEEVAEIIKAIPDDSPLLDIPWFGSDGTGRLFALIGDRAVAEKAARLQFTGGVFSQRGPFKISLLNALNFSLNSGLEELSGYGANTYDAFCLLAEAMAELEPNAEKDEIWGALKRINFFGGIGGPFELDENSDRATGFFQFYSVTETDSAYRWSLFANYENTFSIRGVLTVNDQK